VALATGSSSSRSLASALHRLRSTLARARAELELAVEDGAAAPIERLLADLSESLELLGDVEKAAFDVVSVLVLDDDERLGELTARSLRRSGFDAETASRFRTPRADEVVVFDLGMLPSLSADERTLLRQSKPIVVTGATDPASRRQADELDAWAYLVKPAEAPELVAEVRRRIEASKT